jgi:hypothetical protein
MERVSMGVNVGASVETTQGVGEDIRAPYAVYAIECLGADGQVKWREEYHNLVTTVGKNDILTQYFKGSGYTAAFYVGLISSTSYTTGPAAGDTASSHGGWTEDQTYSNATRPTLTLGTASGGSIDNSANKAQFTINGSATIKGAFLITNSTKGGTTGTLYSAGTFSGGDRTVSNGDTLNTQVTLSAS